ncbi:hypothetical protein ACFVUN_00570 [Kitasatospora griseola]|uniref:hypothetical protein n=1 Tax=Kitasatospora griseola TaxID=2064 RepID=UPI0036DA5C09
MSTDHSPVGLVFSSSAVDEPVAADRLPLLPSVERSPFLEPETAPASATNISSSGRRDPLGRQRPSSQMPALCDTE